MRDTDNWPLLQDMSSAGTSATKARSTPPKEETSANANHVNKKDSNLSNSENSSISGDFVQDTVHEKSDKNYENIESEPTDLGKPCINDSKENVNPDASTSPESTNTTGKRKKPKSKYTCLYINLGI